MTLLDQYSQDILRIAASHGARSVRVFGSFAIGEASSASDLDLLVCLDPGRDLLDLIGLKQEVEQRIGRPVDVVTEKGLSPHLRETILRQAKPL